MTNNPTIDGVSRELITVPVDPTEEMRLAFGKQMRDGNYNEGTLAGDMCLGIWQAMVAAAPAVERQDPVGELEIYGYQCRQSATEKFSLCEYPQFWQHIALVRKDDAEAKVAALQSTIAQLQVRVAELESGRGEPFQSRVQPWMIDCFGPVIAGDREERNHRFLEEALELVQACGASANEAHQLVDYVYGRPVGEPTQEVGGVMVTLAALCLANGMDMHAAAETELARIWTKVEQIRAKQAAKPAMSPLPGAYPDRAPPAPVAVVPDGWKLVPIEPTAEMLENLAADVYPDDKEAGIRLQRLRGTNVVFPKHEVEMAVGKYARMLESVPDCLDATAALNGERK